MTQREMFEKSFERPKNFFKFSNGKQWDIDKELGILDWDGTGLSKEVKDRYKNHYE